MRLIFICSLLMLLSKQLAHAQGYTQGILIGLDLSKNIPAYIDNKYFFQKSFIIEPSIMIPLGNRGFHFNLVPGFSSISAYPVFKNLAYHNQGFYLKAGFDYVIEPYIYFGSAAVISVYDEFGRFVLEGPYYGDAIFSFESRRIRAAGGEFHIVPRIPVNDRLFINFVFRGGIHTDVSKFQPDSYYIPGMGVTSRDFSVTGGVSINVQYAIPIR